MVLILDPSSHLRRILYFYCTLVSLKAYSSLTGRTSGLPLHILFKLLGSAVTTLLKGVSTEVQLKEYERVVNVCVGLGKKRKIEYEKKNRIDSWDNPIQ
jgi:hypothetical protein